MAHGLQDVRYKKERQGQAANGDEIDAGIQPDAQQVERHEEDDHVLEQKDRGSNRARLELADETLEGEEEHQPDQRLMQQGDGGRFRRGSHFVIRRVLMVSLSIVVVGRHCTSLSARGGIFRAFTSCNHVSERLQKHGIGAVPAAE